MGYGRQWTEEEIKLIGNKKLSNHQLAIITGRTESSVRHKRDSVIGHVQTNHYWTPYQISLIKKGELTNREIAKISGKTPKAVQDKRRSILRQTLNKDKYLYFDSYDGPTIKKKRKELQISMYDLASYCGVSVTSISHAEAGEETYKTLRILCTLILKDFEYEIINWERMGE